MPVIHANSGLYFVSYEGVRESSESKLLKIISEIKATYPKLSIEILVSKGSLKKELETFISKHQVEAVVMGLASKTKLTKFIYGSQSTDIAGKINAPVIIVPEKYKNHQLKTILLGVDNQEKLQQSSMTKFKNILKDSKAKLKLVHVRTKEELFAPLRSELKFLNKVYKADVFFAKDAVDGINKFVGKNNIDLIVVVSKRHSVFYDYFAETTTKKLAFVSKMPVMAIHE